MYSDHEFESDVLPGSDQGKCTAEVMVHNPDFDHYPEDLWIEVDETDESGRPLSGRVDLNAPCQECKTDRNSEIHNPKRFVPCGLSAYSVVHPPDQFRHWCSALEGGYDCMHFEDY